MKDRNFKPYEAAQEIKDIQRQAENSVLSGFSKQGLIGRNLRGFDIINFYHLHPELLHEFEHSEAGFDYGLFVRAIIDSNVLELAKKPMDNAEQLSLQFDNLQHLLSRLIRHKNFINCTHLVEEFSNCLIALKKGADNALIVKAILDILSSMMTKLYEAKK